MYLYVFMYCIALHCMVWYGMYVTYLLQFTKQVMDIAKNRGDRIWRCWRYWSIHIWIMGLERAISSDRACAVAVGFQKGGLNNVSFWHLTGSLPVVTMQLARAFMAVCLGYIASLSLQGCGSDDDTLSVATDGDANTTTMTETMTATTTAGDTVTATTTMTVTETMTSTMTETMTSTMTDTVTVTVTSTMTETVTSTSTVTTVASLWVLPLIRTSQKCHRQCPTAKLNLDYVCPVSLLQ